MAEEKTNLESAVEAAPQGKGKKKLIVIGTILVVAIIFVVAMLIWHEKPSFCGTICHTPMHRYVEDFNNPENNLLSSQHGTAEVECLDCHSPKIIELIGEGVRWVTGNYEFDTSYQLLRHRTELLNEEFCLREGCHDQSQLDAVDAEQKYAPHNNHMSANYECTDCHNVHIPSTYVCATCHADATPEGWEAVKSDDANVLSEYMAACETADTLAGTHKSSSFASCVDCHDMAFIEKAGNGEAVSASVSEELCMKCHTEDQLAAVDAELERAPHNNHMSASVECADCHSAHGQSVWACASCHADATPEGWAAGEGEASPAAELMNEMVAARDADPTLLVAKHNNYRVSCFSCHSTEEIEAACAALAAGEESGLAANEELCMTCHSQAQLDNVDSKYTARPPHTNHMSTKTTCDQCHQVHEASVNTCTQCHMDAPLPEGWVNVQGQTADELPATTSAAGAAAADYPENDATKAAVEAMEANPELLGAKHGAMGLGCNSCHETPELEAAVIRTDGSKAEIATTETCMTCHNQDQLDAVDAEYTARPPHKNHVSTQVKCYQCHNAHTESINYCTQCHMDAPLPDAGWVNVQGKNPTLNKK